MTGCTTLEGTGDKGYVTQDGMVAAVAVDDRGDAVSYDGEDLNGDPLSLRDFRGEAVVLVVWGSWCTDCRVEAPLVGQAADELDGKVQFLGLNLRDSNTAQAQAYVRSFGVDYPSFYAPDGDFIAAFPRVLTLQSIPAFVVLDREGRVAASILGRLPSVRTLVDLADEVAQEPVRG